MVVGGVFLGGWWLLKLRCSPEPLLGSGGILASNVSAETIKISPQKRDLGTCERDVSARRRE